MNDIWFDNMVGYTIFITVGNSYYNIHNQFPIIRGDAALPAEFCEFLSSYNITAEYIFRGEYPPGFEFELPELHNIGIRISDEDLIILKLKFGI